jgi:NTE family protein
MNTTKPYDTICLSGGGVKGISFIGALKYLEDQSHLNINDISNWVGTSAGAILSFILSLGYSIEEIQDFILDFNFKMLEPDVCIENLLGKYGIISSDKLMYMINKFLKEKYNLDDITFEEHYKLTNKKLTVIGTNFSKGIEAVFNYINYPKMSVLTAVRISISVPVVFMPVEFESDFYVDGALVNNFPINHCNPETTLGLYIKNSCCNQMKNIITLIQGCFSILADTISRKDCPESNTNYKVIEILNNVQEFTNFNLDVEKKKKIIKMGIDPAKEYLEKIPKPIIPPTETITKNDITNEENIIDSEPQTNNSDNQNTNTKVNEEPEQNQTQK